MHANRSPERPADAPATDASTEDAPAKDAPAKETRTKAPAAKDAAATAGRTKQPPAKTRAAKKDGPAAGRAARQSSPGAPREGSTMWAAIQVLRDQREPMTPKDVYAEIAKRKLAPGLKGKTPEQTVAATLAVAAKRGQHVERAAPGKFRLRRERP